MLSVKKFQGKSCEEKELKEKKLQLLTPKIFNFA
jgi:hypothetical protein